MSPDNIDKAEWSKFKKFMNNNIWIFFIPHVYLIVLCIYEEWLVP